MRLLKKTGLILLTGSLTLTGCQSMSQLFGKEDTTSTSNTTQISSNTQQQQALNKSNLEDYKWQLVQATDKLDQPITQLNNLSEKVTLTFRHDNGSDYISFSGDCNKMGGAYKLSKNTMTVSHIQSTLMLCQGSDTVDRILASAMQGDSQLTYKSNLAKSTNGHTISVPTLKQKTALGQTLLWRGSKTAKARHTPNQ